MAAELRTDRTTGASDAHHRIAETRTEQLRNWGHGIAAEQVFNGDRAKRIDASPTGVEVINRGDLQHRDRLALQLSDDAAAPRSSKAN